VLIVSGELEERRSLLPQTLEIDNFIVGSASVPALPDDPDPFESQGADGGVVLFAFGALAVVVSAGPEGVLNGLGGKLMKGLAKELGTKVTPTDAKLFAAALDDRSDAGEGDQFIGSLPATAIRAEGGGQPGSMDWTGAGESREQMVIVVGLAESFDMAVVFRDGRDDGLHLGQQDFEVND